MKPKLRHDLELIASLVEPNTKLLEVGCSEGLLLEYLSKSKNVSARGIDISEDYVSECVAKGLFVVHGDADEDLKFYPDKAFDYVVSSQMLQATHKPEYVLQHMLRIGKKVIVSIPNFGHWYNRLYLACRGKMPVSSSLSYQWYETPNIHFCTISDFNILCERMECSIEQQIFTGYSSPIEKIMGKIFSQNLFAQHGIFVLTNQGSAKNS